MNKNWEDLTQAEQLAITYSDMYKDVHGFRPRTTAGPKTVSELTKAIDSLQADVDRSMSTFEGREQLRADGWVADETDPALIIQALSLALQRDAHAARIAGEYWDCDDAEEPRLRARWLK